LPFTYKYVALFVPRLRAAEAFYRSVFDLELLFRESEQGDGSWKTLRAGLDWDDAEARGIEVRMVALRRDELVLALSRGKPPRARCTSSASGCRSTR
jgi:catechol 2,3-dioxygenase-like lactoylglutathione lyase family enzyme